MPTPGFPRRGCKGARTVVDFIPMAALAALAAVGVFGLVEEAWRHGRHRRVAGSAAERGWTHRARANGEARRLGPQFPLLTAGGYPRVRDLVEMAHPDPPVVCFDLTWSEFERGRPQLRRYAIAILELPGEVPTVRIDGETVASRIAGALGEPPIAVEHPGFNRRFRVRAPRRGDAYGVLHPEAIELLLASDREVWELAGHHLLTAQRGRWQERDYGQVAAAMRRFAGLLPDWVVEMTPEPVRR